MLKTGGLKTEYVPIRNTRSSFVVSYNLQADEQDDRYATWCEVYFYKTKYASLDFDTIKAAVLTDINDYVKERIISGFEWLNYSVWLSIENQNNYKNALDIAIQTEGSNLPVTFKFGDDDNPIYYKFETIDSLKDFWIACSNHITECIAEGWKIKDSIDWEKYK